MQNNALSQEQINGIVRALEKPNYKWRTLRGVAKEVGVPEVKVYQVLKDGGVKEIRNHRVRVVQSSVPSKTGEVLFSTDRHFRKMASPGEKLIGAIRNRLR